jgi:hypothetical protein
MSRPETKDPTRHVFRGDSVPGLAVNITQVQLSAILKQELTGPALPNYLRHQQQSFHAILNHTIPCPTS